MPRTVDSVAGKSCRRINYRINYFSPEIFAIENDKQTSTNKLLISLFIAAILIIQAFFIPARILTGFTSSWYWPFIDYPMYDQAHYENERVQTHLTLKVTLRDGTIVLVDQEDLGLRFWHFHTLAKNLKMGASKAVDVFLELYPRRAYVVELGVYSSPYIVTRQGIAETEPDLIRSISI